MAFNLSPDDLSVNPASKSAAHGITAFPCDLPSQEELREWLPNLQSRIDAMGLSAYMRGSEPPHVLQYTPRDLALIPVLPADAGEGPKEGRVALRATYEHDNAIKLAMKTEWSRDQQQKVASVILESMRHTAVSRFESLRLKHQQLDNAGDVIDNAYNGIAMAKELVAKLAAGVVVLYSTQNTNLCPH